MSMIDTGKEKILGVLQDRKKFTAKRLMEATGSTRLRVNEILNVLEGAKIIHI